MTQLNFLVTQNNFRFEPSNFLVAEWMLIFFQFKEEFSDFGITFVRFRGWDLFSTQQHYLACWVLDYYPARHPPSRDQKKGIRNRKVLCVTGKYHEQRSETRKDIPGTGKLLSQPEKNNMKPEKVFTKPENYPQLV